MKFVHAADLHIDSPLRGLERYQGAPVERVRGATRRALENLVELCLSEEAAFLLLAGDVFDGDWKDYGTGLFFVAQMTRLRQGGIPVFMVRGNHDAASHVTRHLSLPDNVQELSSRRPETQLLERHGIAIHGQSFATRAVTDDLAAAYPAPVPGLLNIGLLHTAADGRAGHEPYAPCSTRALVDKGYDYWALGHVHAREVLSQSPWIVFPGNLQGRHANETGPKGATVVTVDGDRITRVDARALDVVRWSACEIAAAAATSAEEAIDAARIELERVAADAEGRLVAARVTIQTSDGVHRALIGNGERWANELRSLALGTVGDALWVERVRFVARPAAAGASGLDGVDGDAIASFVSAVRAVAADDTQLLRLGEEVPELAALQRKLPADLRDGEGALRLDDPETLRRLLAEAEALVVDRLGGAEEPR